MSIPLPSNLEIKKSKEHRAQIVIEPCYPGYGVTLGNALRRVLLPSIEGAAITSFKLKGAQHEFSSLPYIKEDVIEIMLNLKAIRLKVFSDEPVILNLKVKGEKVVTAKDIAKNAQVEIINLDQTICAVTDKSSEVEMEFVAQKGRGYVTVEERENEKVDLGTIIIDAVYTPLVNVGFEIENVRVGDKTDYERLILKIETDGTITPEEALKQAADILVNHFQFVSNGKAEPAAILKEPSKEDIAEPLAKAVSVKAPEPETAKKKRGRPKKQIN